MSVPILCLPTHFITPFPVPDTCQVHIPPLRESDYINLFITYIKVVFDVA